MIIVVIVTYSELNMQLVLTNENGNNKTTATKLWEVFFGQGIIRISGIIFMFKYNKCSLFIYNLIII